MFSQRLVTLRKEKKLSQYALADELGFSRGKLANYEQGSREPDFETLTKIATYFNVTTDYLLGNSDVRYPEPLKKYVEDPELNAWLFDMIENRPEDVKRVKEILELMAKQAKEK
ncbi:helix-turn-helix domain-containing protein [Listeria booriae]|uniref:Helix-turn-helix transcriptional regulator n=1 Tax=Listeria booriae TaxID=1552123 RepID=A0A842F3D2_9LIST|nr:helix-turn-helix transcriptional regulator [Listeria booriae]MBC1523604.1 helix-turn-helix transcriptional regulator [Listeria booriae]MBC2158696.1 helix-turn-helix transcriptional regulator [Listeria booriae]MBC2241855.1 helix-turn-helix transcriptional regulator [Listeria booriae]